MIIYVNQFDETLYHFKKNCLSDLQDAFSESWGDDDENNSSILCNALDVCESLKDNDYVCAGRAIQRMTQVYNDAWDEFYNKYYCTVEGTETEVKKETNAMIEEGFTWEDDEEG